MSTNQINLLVVGMLALARLNTPAADAKITVDVARPGHKIPPTLWGIFFEDINLSADGGIYPELVRNRSFEDSDKPENWRLINATDGRCEMAIDSSRPLNPLNRRSLRLKVDGAGSLENDGYWGMNMVKGDGYTLRLAARAADGFTGPLNVSILSASGQKLAGGEISGLTDNWKYHTLDLTASDSDPKARLQISVFGKGMLFLDMVSLLPKKTWKNHGLRIDLCEAIAALKPAFLRFPGGCWVEGDDMAHMYNWKKTIGDIDVRTPLWNIWGYHATHGLGYHEYLQLAEDLGAEPLFCINAGMSHKENVPMSQMGQWVQDALDAIEYANGPVDSLWGGLRARAGHPEPFNMKYLEIGNENGGPAYRERWALFVKAIRAKYPNIQLVANHWQGGYPKEPRPDIVDEHFYNSPEWFMANSTRFDTYDRNGPKIFVGEYAVTRNCGNGNLRGAIAEAAFMTGMERNSDVVIMAAYAPLFCNLNHKRWPINLINFDSSCWYGLPGYYVQKLFAENRGDVLLPTRVETGDVQQKSPTGCIGVGTWNTQAEFKDVRVTAPDGKVLFQSDFSKDAAGWKMLGEGRWSVKDGALQQTAEREFIRAIAGDRSWGDYTIELKARKLAGREGFLILFHIQDDDDRNWWNIAGWNNTQHAVELGETLDPKRGRVETGRWYDIKVELRGHSVKCWLDGRLVHDIKNALVTSRRIYASATRDNSADEIILKVVNTAPSATAVEIDLAGAKKLAQSGTAVVLTHDDPRAENSLDAPHNVVPRSETIAIPAPKFTREFPANSFTVIRLPVQ